MIAARLRAWFENRLPLSDTHVLTQGNIYIVPTKAGLAFALTLLLMLIASINYQLNLGYLLTFLLAGSALVSMHVTHGTLRGLTLRIKSPNAVFLGQPVEVEVVLSNEKGARHGIGVSVRRKRPDFAWCDVPSQGSVTARVRFAARVRGRMRVPTLMAETRFPLGLFRAWTVWRPEATVLVYPKPESPPKALPPAQPVPGQVQTASRVIRGAEFDGVRSYRRGDSPRRVVWKKVARSGELISRDTNENLSRELWLEFEGAAPLDSEARLSRLTAWVLAAEGAGMSFGMRLPGFELSPAQGEDHRRTALEALALW